MRYRGTVRFFNDNKGYGFIRREGSGADLYVHYRDIEGGGFRTLNVGETVEFELMETERGPRAVCVSRIEAF
ncbi:MAG: cold shock domain-containing protein [bacterium]|nr:MAG: cold shock domain-containing protein [bacterium]